MGGGPGLDRGIANTRNPGVILKAFNFLSRARSEKSQSATFDILEQENVSVIEADKRWLNNIGDDGKKELKKHLLYP